MIDDAYTRDRRVLTHALRRPTAVVPSALLPTQRTVPGRGANRVILSGGRPAPLLPERNGYWFPMLLFGILILAAPLVYRPSTLPTGIDPFWHIGDGRQMPISGLAFAPLQQFGTCSEALGDPMLVALYWFCVVMFGPLLTLGWYHLRARRLGVPPQTGWFLLFASASLLLYVMLYPVIEFVTLTLPRDATIQFSPTAQHVAAGFAVAGFLTGLAIAAAAVVPRRFGRTLSRARWTIGGLGLLLAIASAAAIELIAYIQPRNSYGALLIIGIGLLALSLAEPGRMCAAIAVVFTSVALVMNLFGLQMPDPPTNQPPPGFSPVHTAMTNLLLPAVILIAGGLVGAAGTLLARRRPHRVRPHRARSATRRDTT
ncbi:MAG TPA: hypothetical protein VH333_18550 [Pseudonocardiaceae bacterium]|nr:hypothetical protein [Pseudonocardiaceae bacterium]